MASCHLDLLRLVHLEVHLEHLEDILVATLEATQGVMGLLEDEGTQSSHRCLGDQAVTGCIGVIETCRRLIQESKPNAQLSTSFHNSKSIGEQPWNTTSRS